MHPGALAAGTLPQYNTIHLRNEPTNAHTHTHTGKKYSVASVVNQHRQGGLLEY